MIESLRIRVFIVLICILTAVVYLTPNFVELKNTWWPTKTKLNYGLDIQGGLHLVMGVDIDTVMKERVVRISRSLKADMEERQIPVETVEVAGADKNEIVVKLSEASKEEDFKKFLNDRYSTVLQVVDQSGTETHLKIYDSTLLEYQRQVLNQSIEVIRNRIDEFGVAEPSITAQGKDRIVVQLPGIKNAERAKELINRTAQLEFRIVSEEMKPEEVAALVAKAEEEGGYKLGKDGMTYAAYYKKINEDLKDKLPENSLVSFEKMENAATLEAGKRPLLLKADTNISGDQLEDAFVSLDQYGKPEVNFRFDSQGKLRMGEVTGNNIGKLLAIVLDDVIQSAPVIKSRITDQGRIELGSRDYKSGLDEANLIATALRAGALPAKLTQLEERTVGPSLGADSIRKGEIAGLVGLVLVVVFMLVYYQSLGIVANVSLILYVLLLLSILTSLGATLTLPGVAGIVLTLGMAVDANVI
ncbi:MAG: protein translocase subunit SecD, partial [Bdellovibrionales bacterium]|nr:protein translocase subunit SecD [Bdellovibrionales bacterium]